MDYKISPRLRAAWLEAQGRMDYEISPTLKAAWLEAIAQQTTTQARESDVESFPVPSHAPTDEPNSDITNKSTYDHSHAPSPDATRPPSAFGRTYSDISDLCITERRCPVPSSGVLIEPLRHAKTTWLDTCGSMAREAASTPGWNISSQSLWNHSLRIHYAESLQERLLDMLERRAREARWDRLLKRLSRRYTISRFHSTKNNGLSWAKRFPYRIVYYQDRPYHSAEIKEPYCFPPRRRGRSRQVKTKRRRDLVGLRRLSWARRIP